jgi:RNA polymerase sigma factor (sigma-70 family)
MCPGNLRRRQVSYLRGNPRRHRCGPARCRGGRRRAVRRAVPRTGAARRLLGADDPEDIAQEAFARLLRSYGSLRDADAALAYVRATVCNLTRSRRRHLRIVRLRTPADRPDDVASSEQAVLLREEQREVIAALATLPVRRREAIVLRYWLGLSEAEIATMMGVSPGTVKSTVSRALATLGKTLEEGR